MYCRDFLSTAPDISLTRAWYASHPGKSGLGAFSPFTAASLPDFSSHPSPWAFAHSFETPTSFFPFCLCHALASSIRASTLARYFSHPGNAGSGPFSPFAGSTHAAKRYTRVRVCGM